MVIVDSKDVTVEQPPPHGAIGMSTAYRISDAVPNRTMEFRRRVLHPGSAIGIHPIDHDEVYFVLSGEGEVASNGETRRLTAGMAAYLYAGADVGIRQMGTAPLDLIISYPLPEPQGEPLLVDGDRRPDEVIPIWPGAAPGGAGVTLQEQLVSRDNPFGLPDHAVHNVTSPMLSVFRAANPNGAAVLIAPGGGYRWVVVEKEGWEAARWFARRGITAYVMTYRLPHQGWAAGPDTPLQDAQRAIRVIRSRAGGDRIDPDRVAVMGFSAGGHVAGSLATRFDARVYSSIDAADDLSARPDAAILIYPVVSMRAPHAHPGSRDNLLGRALDEQQLEKYSIDSFIPADTPPTFLIHAADDTIVPVENALGLFSALRSAKVPATLHVFEEGGHGFGLRGADKLPVGDWPMLVLTWMSAQGLSPD